MYFQGYEPSNGVQENGVATLSEPAPSAEQHQMRPMDPAPMAYPAYQQYYYPDYAYSSYVDPSRQQVMQYEVYPSDAQPQPMVFY